MTGRRCKVMDAINGRRGQFRGLRRRLRSRLASWGRFDDLKPARFEDHLQTALIQFTRELNKHGDKPWTLRHWRAVLKTCESKWVRHVLADKRTQDPLNNTTTDDPTPILDRLTAWSADPLRPGWQTLTVQPGEDPVKQYFRRLRRIVNDAARKPITDGHDLTLAISAIVYRALTGFHFSGRRHRKVFKMTSKTTKNATPDAAAILAAMPPEALAALANLAALAGGGEAAKPTSNRRKKEARKKAVPEFVPKSAADRRADWREDRPVVETIDTAAGRIQLIDAHTGTTERNGKTRTNNYPMQIQVNADRYVGEINLTGPYLTVLAEVLEDESANAAFAAMVDIALDWQVQEDARRDAAEEEAWRKKFA